MQKVQILQGTPEATFCIDAVPDAASGLATERYIRKNLITNGDMEINGNWAAYNGPAVSQQDATKLKTGNFSWLFTPNAANEGVQSDAFTTVTGEKYYYTIWVYPDDDDKMTVVLRKGDDSGYLYNEIHTGLTENAWNELKVNVTELAGGDGAYFIFHSGVSTSGDWYIANIFGSKVQQQGVHTGRKASRAYITVEDQSIRWATGGATVTAGAAGVGHEVAAGGSIELQNFDAIRNFQFLNETGSSVARLQITVCF